MEDLLEQEKRDYPRKVICSECDEEFFTISDDVWCEECQEREGRFGMGCSG